ncbi:MAG: prolyl oligopeptidase family serine peptidase [Streptosporangiales bacterium]
MSTTTPTPFHDLEAYVELPRTSGLLVSPDGSQLVATCSALSSDRKSYVSSLWRIDPTGERPAVRLTRSTKGESTPAFLPDGSLLFVSKRPDPDATEPESDDERGGLWLLPAGGGEPRRVMSRPSGVGGVAVARDAGTVVLTADVLPSAEGGDDAELVAQRRDRGVTAILHTGYPIRHWDHHLGPPEPHLLRVEPGDGRWDEVRDLTPGPGRALDEQAPAVAVDGSTVVTGWQVTDGRGALRAQVRALDAATGASRVLLDDPLYDVESPAVSPDGTQVVAVRSRRPTYEEPSDITLVTVPLAGGEPRDLLPELDLRPGVPVWAPDSTACFTTVDEAGRGRVLRVEIESGSVTRLTGDDAAYSSVQVSADGQYVYALRAAVDEPPTPVRLDARAPGQQPTRLPAPADAPPLPGRLTEVTAAADDGQPLRAWLVLPDGASDERPAPLLLWVHGGPHSSWNSWQWRWNPWLMAARGYAVLLPDPALSTGYGLDFHRRGWGAWGERPYTDLMAMTDAVVDRPDIDASRTAAMGGSFGGYMANWIATHTDRFDAIVSHAGLWALDQFNATTDLADHWHAQFGDPVTRPERYERNSPQRDAGRISTPMLVIHGDKDYRVPVGEGLRLWWDLASREADAKFLYFPDENHWIMQPGNIIVWYETVHAFLAEHVLGEKWVQPSFV